MFFFYVWLIEIEIWLIDIWLFDVLKYDSCDAKKGDNWDIFVQVNEGISFQI